MKPLEGTEISILGLGASGVAAARLALAKGGAVYVSDRRTEPAIAARGAQLGELGAGVELGEHDLERIAASATVVVSPGIPPDAPVLRALAHRGVGWISEPEFAFHFLSGELIAVTGTNGKTTTAALTAHLLRNAGVETALGGNIGAAFGPPVSELALLEPSPAWFVVELSSFQLAYIQDLRPTIGVVTNLAPDHLDRYPSVEAYYADKSRLFENADDRSRWVLNRDDPAVGEMAAQVPGERFWFGLREKEGTHAFLRDGELVLAWGDSETPLLHHDELALLGRHNVANALTASLSAVLAGAETGTMASGLKSFPALPHRLEPVGSARGLRWVNDSKATNVAATVGALESLRAPLVLLLGGKDKGEDLTPLRQAMHAGVRHVVLYGEARKRMADALEGTAPLRVVSGSFEAAVDTAAELARPGDILLLSPACSSFDMFQNYEARGSRFAALARGDA